MIRNGGKNNMPTTICRDILRTTRNEGNVLGGLLINSRVKSIRFQTLLGKHNNWF